MRKSVAPGEIARAILVLRGHRVLLDAELAALYGVTTKRLNEQVKRNAARFPADFIFRLTPTETVALNRSQNATGSQKHRTPRLLPYAFTEHGVAMLSSVLNSERAVQMSILVVRAFVKLREVLASHRDLARKIERLEGTQKDHGAVLSIVINDIQDLGKHVANEFKKMRSPRRRKPRIGFKVDAITDP
jgi:hypothetical protein